MKVDRHNIYGLVVAYVTALVMGVVAIQYAEHIDRRSNAQWCAIVVTVNQSYAERPPDTDSARDLAAEFQRLQHEFGCD